MWMQRKKITILCDEKAVRSLNDFTSGPEAEESECVGVPATLEILREMEMLSDREGRHIFHLAGIYVRE